MGLHCHDFLRRAVELGCWTPADRHRCNLSPVGTGLRFRVCEHRSKALVGQTRGLPLRPALLAQRAALDVHRLGRERRCRHKIVHDLVRRLHNLALRPASGLWNGLGGRRVGLVDTNLLPHHSDGRVRSRGCVCLAGQRALAFMDPRWCRRANSPPKVPQHRRLGCGLLVALLHRLPLVFELCKLTRRTADLFVLDPKGGYPLVIDVTVGNTMPVDKEVKFKEEQYKHYRVKPTVINPRPDGSNIPMCASKAAAFLVSARARTKIPPRTVALTMADALMSATLLVYDRWAVRLNLFSPLEFIPGGRQLKSPLHESST
ncbi:hypothetical protein J8273_2573 [Carpediemonas membranifera]|uniref:Uncharacterized protein n=1 Tax=Carpediemonas membranifera TaxID=201153 RepID=A0A8J6E3Z6_9EUKA|nr:hypothetical protein J8273_2573 [Carpediemonas membranifera]|eukprot:KAG9396221.1 hypothetical protein J8273_2573 [Carpediemonas membranifera]